MESFPSSDKRSLDSSPIPKAVDGLGLLSAKEAKVDPGTIRVIAGDFGKGFQVPTFSLEFDKSNYAIILRCRRDYRAVVQSQMEMAQSQMKREIPWLWSSAIGNKLDCRVAHTEFRGGKFQDIAAPQGAFFYLLNPCVDKSKQVDPRQDNCSYDLKYTQAISFRGTSMSDAFAKKSAELVLAEGEYEALIRTLHALGKEVIKAKENCAAEESVRLDSYKSSNIERNQIQAQQATIGAAVAGLGAVAFFGSRSMLRQRSWGRSIGMGMGALAFTGVAVFAAIRSQPQSSPGFVQEECQAAEAPIKAIRDMEESKILSNVTSKMIRLSRS